LISWSLVDDEEIEAFDVPANPKVFWDSAGYAYITEGNQVLLTQMGVRLTCFDVEKINNEDAQAMKDKKNLKFGYQYGHRFDTAQHSWLYLRDYISLSYSYMTFVIKKKFDDEDVDYTNDDYLFDLEQYNYMLNRKTALSESSAATADHDKLLYILRSFEEIDPVLLEQIQYYHVEERDTSKQKADEEGEEDDDAELLD